jgi:proton-translocating NAD(P)+ transhydrogenase subunit beta
VSLRDLFIELSYLIAAILFIVGLKRLSSPTTARSGNLVGAVGMLLAVGATLFEEEIVSFTAIVVGVVIGTIIGAVTAKKVKMTAMPQMVAAFNGFGGGASALVAVEDYLRAPAGSHIGAEPGLSVALSVLIGAVTFSGSFVAYGKLEEIVTGRPVVYPLQKTSNAILFAGILAITIFLGVAPVAHLWLWVLLAASFVLGILVVIPIGGADMPVVISLLNSYSGLAGCAAGFVLQNNVLIIAGALVGASGIILTRIMCTAMNRSLANVLFGAFGGGGGPVATVVGPGADGKIVRDITAEDAATLMAYSRSVVVVPGYGLAVAQAQHQVRELAELLEKRGVEVKYAIHPVAGRMPGHMNVLLAEANVPYPQLYEMDQINPEMKDTDVALVVGANDVVNPAARTDPSSPIYGMPIIDVDYAKNVIVMKRSMNPGFAGIDNPLFYNDNTRMLFGDAKSSMNKLISEMKHVQ